MAEKRRHRGERRFDDRGRLVPTVDRPEKILLGRRVVEAIKGRGTPVPVPHHVAFDALIMDLSSAETVPVWMVDRAAAQANGSPPGSIRVPATKRMVEFAQGVANGETAEETAERLGVKYGTVSKALERLIFRLGARSRVSAVAMLVHAGYITAPEMPEYARGGRPEFNARKIQTVDVASVNLTAIEVDLLGRMSHGAGNADIAAGRGRSEQTIKAQVQALLRKLGARDRTHAVAIALRSGLID